MNHKKHLLLAVVIFTAMQSVNAQYYYQLSTGTSQSTHEDADGLVGIGTITPTALLQITQPLTTSPDNYFQITATALTPPSTVVEETIFKVDASGNVGIGTATPGAPLQIRGKGWYNDVSDFGGAPLQIFTDPAERTIGGFFNAGYETGNPGGTFLVVGNPDSDFPVLGVWNPTNEVIPFAVLANSTIGMGVDVSSSANFIPEAQVTITKNNNYDHMFKIQSADQAQNYFDVDNSGHVGVGIEAGTTDGALTVYENGSDTHLDILGTYQQSAIRFFEYSTTHPTHTIGNNGGDLLIDPGVASGGGHDKLKVDGDEEITGSVNIGFGTNSPQPVPSVLGSTLALHNNSSTYGPLLDLFQEDNVTGWNGQIRFGRRYNNGAEQCAVRHVIADNYDNGELVIAPGFNASEGNSVAVLHIYGTTIIGEKKITATPHDNAQLFVDGKIAAKYVVVTESNWADHVFNNDYALRSLPDLENYITKNHHLPEVPSECEVEEKGVNIGEMNATLLKKIEELTLYVLAQQKQMDKMKEELNVLSNH
ncbi:MAG: hypothetical protein NTY88_02465 [Bacteroidetes bacterium]|nr:hypothetical protein [Bacteroidota bacterium]